MVQDNKAVTSSELLGVIKMLVIDLQEETYFGMCSTFVNNNALTGKVTTEVTNFSNDA